MMIQIYILLTINTHRHDRSPSNQVMGSMGHKYKNIIASLVLGKKVGTGIKVNLPHTMILKQQDRLYPLG